jgi:hypothetical protein
VESFFVTITDAGGALRFQYKLPTKRSKTAFKANEIAPRFFICTNGFVDKILFFGGKATEILPIPIIIFCQNP